MQRILAMPLAMLLLLLLSIPLAAQTMDLDELPASHEDLGDSLGGYVDTTRHKADSAYVATQLIALAAGIDSTMDSVIVNQALIAALAAGIDSTMDSVVVNQELIAILQSQSIRDTVLVMMTDSGYVSIAVFNDSAAAFRANFDATIINTDSLYVGGNAVLGDANSDTVKIGSGLYLHTSVAAGRGYIRTDELLNIVVGSNINITGPGGRVFQLHGPDNRLLFENADSLRIDMPTLFGDSIKLPGSNAILGAANNLYLSAEKNARLYLDADNDEAGTTFSILLNGLTNMLYFWENDSVTFFQSSHVRVNNDMLVGGNATVGDVDGDSTATLMIEVDANNHGILMEETGAGTEYVAFDVNNSGTLYFNMSGENKAQLQDNGLFRLLDSLHVDRDAIIDGNASVGGGLTVTDTLWIGGLDALYGIANNTYLDAEKNITFTIDANGDEAGEVFNIRNGVSGGGGALLFQVAETGDVSIPIGGLTVADSLIVGTATTDGGAGNHVQVRKDRNGAVRVNIENQTAGSSASAGVRMESNSADGILFVGDDGQSTAAYADKLVLITTTGSGISIIPSGVNGFTGMYAGGTAATNLEAVIWPDSAVFNDDVFIDSSLSVGGDLTMNSGDIYFGGLVSGEQFQIMATTADGSDSLRFDLAAGGGTAQGRGASISLHGNDKSTAAQQGDLWFLPGTNGEIEMFDASGDKAIAVEDDSTALLAPKVLLTGDQIYHGGDVVYQASDGKQFSISAGTADASDTLSTAWNSGGASGQGRGGFITMYGNDYSNANLDGDIQLYPGSDGAVELYDASGDKAIAVEDDSTALLAPKTVALGDLYIDAGMMDNAGASGTVGQVPKADGSGGWAWGVDEVDTAGTGGRLDIAEAALDSVRGGTLGDGASPALDTTYYDYIFGSTKQDSASYGAFSGFRYYDGGLADSVAADSFNAAIVALKSSGGEIFLLGGDSLFFFEGDSFAVADSFSAVIRITGTHKYQSLLCGDPDDNRWANWHFQHSFKPGGRLEFRNVGIVSTDAASDYLSVGFLGFTGRVDVLFDNCLLVREAVVCFTLSTTGTSVDSTVIYRNCEFEDFTTIIQQYGAVYGQYIVESCYGTIREWYFATNTTGAPMHRWLNNRIRTTGHGINGAGTTAQKTIISGGYYEFGANAVNPFYRMGVNASGATFRFDVSGSNPYVSTLTEIYSFAGCTFINGGIKHNSGSVSIVGCSFVDYDGGAIALDIDASTATISGNYFEGWTTAIDVAGALSNVTVGGSVGGNNTTDINGTPNTAYDNTWY